MAEVEKHAGGRPSKLTQELADMAVEYVISKHQELGDVVPSHAGLCCYLAISKSTLYEYAKMDSDLGRQFSDTLSAINVKQEKMLLSGALVSTYNPAIAKLMLSNHGYNEKVAHVGGSSTDNPIKTESTFRIVRPQEAQKDGD